MTEKNWKIYKILFVKAVDADLSCMRMVVFIQLENGTFKHLFVKIVYARVFSPI